MNCHDEKIATFIHYFPCLSLASFSSLTGIFLRLSVGFSWFCFQRHAIFTMSYHFAYCLLNSVILRAKIRSLICRTHIILSSPKTDNLSLCCGFCVFQVKCFYFLLVIIAIAFSIKVICFKNVMSLVY